MLHAAEERLQLPLLTKKRTTTHRLLISPTVAGGEDKPGQTRVCLRQLGRVSDGSGRQWRNKKHNGESESEIDKTIMFVNQWGCGQK